MSSGAIVRRSGVDVVFAFLYARFHNVEMISRNFVAGWGLRDPYIWDYHDLSRGFIVDYKALNYNAHIVRLPFLAALAVTELLIAYSSFAFLVCDG